MSYPPKFEDIEARPPRLSSRWRAGMAVLKAQSSRLKTQGARLVKVNKRKATLNGEP